ncbi:hypothetical protein BABINDRAFT_38298 [Babjeviella inositovora NRRL Y-12698]|uniref:Tom7-domain-containing protein n=1 Tax=Babjeviella inositovora NRRL Y-12698 TaxID=984486 RepID=A0A1E3QMR5_9ASCO|nr:uncharacterized protein BABINDRAFT_38298 [Babjeviella inositovora NRRL Y-12698]ODQ78975.1 hypothetical protein BABINDRAFT_38298 [Babjeviella inositovora NRRL Y-12698]
MANYELSEESKERVVKVLDAARTVAHYGWIPFVLYLGWTSTNPTQRPSLIKYV